MLIAINLSLLGVVGTVFGIIALLTSAAFIVLGTRSKALISQQNDSITALTGRVTALESENRELTAKVATSNALVIAKEAEILSAETRISALERVVTQAAELADFRAEVNADHERILAAINGKGP